MEARSVLPIVDDGVGGGLHRGEVGDQGRSRSLRRYQPENGARDDAEGAAAADEELEQRQAGYVLDPLATEGDQGPIGEHHIEPEHVVGRDAVLHAAQSARIRRDVAADRADFVRRRVRRIPQAMLSRRRLDFGIEGTGLDHGDSGSDVDLDRAHPLQAQHDAAGNRRGSAGEATARPPRHHRYAVLGRPSNRGLTTCGASRVGPRRSELRPSRRGTSRSGSSRR